MRGAAAAAAAAGRRGKQGARGVRVSARVASPQPAGRVAGCGACGAQERASVAAGVRTSALPRSGVGCGTARVARPRALAPPPTTLTFTCCNPGSPCAALAAPTLHITASSTTRTHRTRAMQGAPPPAPDQSVQVEVEDGPASTPGTASRGGRARGPLTRLSHGHKQSDSYLDVRGGRVGECACKTRERRRQGRRPARAQPRSSAHPSLSPPP